MSDKIIISCVIMAAVFLVAVLFIRRAICYRKRMKQMAGVSAPSDDAILGLNPPQVTDADRYLVRFICLLRLPFRSSKTVKIRPEYYERMRDIIRVIGHNDVSITAYVDKVLKAHFEDNRESIDSLCELYSRPSGQESQSER